jgi:hypothetical protein
MIAGLLVTLLAFCCVLLIPSLPLQGAYGHMGKGKTEAAAAPPAH